MEHIPRIAKKKLYYNRTNISFRINFNSITAEALNIEDNIFLNDNHQDKLKYDWIDYLMAFPSDRLDSLSSLENVDQ